MLKSNLKNLITGNAAAQIITVLSLPFITRIYSSEQFSLLAIVMMLGLLSSIVSNLQINNLIVKIYSRRLRQALFSMSFFLSFFILTIVYLATITFNFLTESNYSLVLTYSIIIAFVLSISNNLKAISASNGDFAFLSVLSVVRAISILMFQLLFGFLEINEGLILGYLVGELLIFSVILAKNKNSVVLIFYPIRLIRKICTNYKQFTLYGTFQEFLSTLVFSFSVFVFSFAYGLDFGGQYALAHKIIWAPVTLIVVSSSQLLLKYYAQIKLESLIETKLYKVNFFYFIYLLFFIAAVLIVEPLFIFIFGEAWAEAADISFYLSFTVFTYIVSIPARVYIKFKSKQVVILVIDVFSLIIILLSILTIQLTEMQGVVLLALMGSISNLIVFLSPFFLEKPSRVF